MSEVKVDTISERTAAGGVTIDGVLIKDGVATFQTAAGSPLVFEGATADAFETTFAITDPTADRTITFPDSSFTVPTAAGGITHMSQWRLTTEFNNTQDPITSNLLAVVAADPTTETASPSSSTALGDPMTVSSGIFTFPSTGYWWVYYTCTTDSETYNASPIGGFINYTTDDSSYDIVGIENAMCYTGYYDNSNTSVFLDITDTTQCKVSFSFRARGATDTCIGAFAINKTFMTFMRVGDT